MSASAEYRPSSFELAVNFAQQYANTHKDLYPVRPEATPEAMRKINRRAYSYLNKFGETVEAPVYILDENDQVVKAKIPFLVTPVIETTIEGPTYGKQPILYALQQYLQVDDYGTVVREGIYLLRGWEDRLYTPKVKGNEKNPARPFYFMDGQNVFQLQRGIINNRDKRVINDVLDLMGKLYRNM